MRLTCPEGLERDHPRAGDSAFLDQRARARLCMAGAAATDRCRQPAPAISRHRRGAPGSSPTTTFGTIVAMVHILLPFMVLPLYSAMQKIPPNLSQAGASLGGGPPHVFCRVFLPLSMSGVSQESPWSSCCASAFTSRPS